MFRIFYFIKAAGCVLIVSQDTSAKRCLSENVPGRVPFMGIRGARGFKTAIYPST